MRRVRPSLKDMSVSFSRRALPIMLWLGGLYFISTSWIKKTNTWSLDGLVHSSPIEISSVQAGRILTIEVDLFDEVRKGDLLARLDDSSLVARLETARAEIIRLASQVASLQQTLQIEAESGLSDWDSEFRRFLVDLEDAKLEELEYLAEAERQTVRVERFRRLRDSLAERLDGLRAQESMAAKQSERIDALVRQGNLSSVEGELARSDFLEIQDRVLLVAQQAEEMEIRLKESETSATSQRALRESAEEKVRASVARLAEFGRARPQGTIQKEDPRLDAVREAVTVQRTRLLELSVERDNLSLFAAADGRVSALGGKLGQAILAGESIMEIVSKGPHEIIAYLPDGLPVVQFENAEWYVQRDQHSAPMKGQVLSFGPSVVEVPRQLWRDANTPHYGRPVLVADPGFPGLLPGERVLVRVERKSS